MRFSDCDLSLRKVTSFLLAAALILTPLCNFRTHTVKAFMPGSWSGFVVGGFNNWSHEAITETAMWSLVNEFGFTQTNQLTQYGIDSITAHNGTTDLDIEFHYSWPHFDGENFYSSQERLKDYKNKIDERMSVFAPTPKQLYESQYALGRALHTLQDFYSHSNWVERDTTPPVEIHPTLGEFGTTLSRPSANIKTCRDCKRDNCNQCLDIYLPNPILTTGYYKGDRDIPDKPAGKCNHGGIALGRPDDFGLGSKKSGINKDTRDCTASPLGEQYHFKAAGAAIEATKKYLREVRDLIGNTQMRLLLGGFPRIGFVVDTTGSMGAEIASVRQQILNIIQTRVSLGLPTQYFLFPFNDPGFGTITMTSDPNVMTSAVNALTADGGGDCPEPVNAALLRAFGEWNAGGDILLFTDARPSDPTLTLAVGSFARSAGIRLTSVFSGANEGCPLIDTRFSSMPFDTGGQFWSLFPSEVGLISHLGNFLALPNQVDLFSRFGVRSTIDQIFTIPIDAFMPRMILGVTGTGATNIVVRRPDNSIVQPNDPNVTRIDVSTGSLYSIISPAVGNWSITITGTGLGMNHTYTSPVAYEASVAYAQSTNEVEDNDVHGPSASLEPAAIAEAVPAVQAPEQFSIRVAGESTIDVNSFDFLELRDVGAHPGFLPLRTNPIAGRTTTVAAKVVAEGSATANFQFRALDGTVLQTLSLQQIPWVGDDPELLIPRESNYKQFIGNVTVPTVPFQVYVTGTGNGGGQYQRLVPGVIRPQTVEIVSEPIPNLHPGQSFAYNIQVKNSGAADTYQLTAVDDLNFLSAVSPTTFSLNTNETKNVKVAITVPTNAVPFSLDNIRFTVEGSVSSASKIVGPFLVTEMPALRLGSFTVTPIGGDGDAFLDPGEGASLSVQLVNNGTATATSISGSLSTSTAGVTVSQPHSDYFNIAPSANATNITPFVFYVPPNTACGAAIQLALTVTSEGNGAASQGEYNFTVFVGQQNLSNPTQSYTGSAVSIPDNNATGVNVNLTVSGGIGTIDDLNFRLDGTTCNSTTTVGLNHTWVSDLKATLRSPLGTTVNLFERVGGDGDNFCKTVLDDQATNLIQNVTAANAPFTGSFKPNQPLTAFRGENPNGVWTLNVSDLAPADIGSVRAFSLLFTNSQFSCNAAPADTTAPSCTPTDFRPGPPASADITTQDTGTGLADINIRSADNVNVTIPPFTAGTTTPIVVSGTLIDPNLEGSFEIESVDVAGNVSTCSRTLTSVGQIQGKVLFNSERDGNYELYTMNDNGTNQTRITNTSTDEYRARLSPDGTKIAFAVAQDGSNTWDIFVMNVNGTNRVNLTHNTEFEYNFNWSPDSTKLAYESSGASPAAIYVINSDGTGKTNLITTGGSSVSPVWSPDGSKIAFVRLTSSVAGRADIWVMGSNGSNPTNLTQTDWVESNPVWSPDGTKILFSKRHWAILNSDLYVMNANGSGLTRLTFIGGVGGYSWSPDGSKIVYTSNYLGDTEVFVINANGSNEVDVSNDAGIDYAPVWSADGLRILFRSYRDGNSEVYLVNTDGSGLTNVTNNAAFDALSSSIEPVKPDTPIDPPSPSAALRRPRLRFVSWWRDVLIPNRPKPYFDNRWLLASLLMQP